MRKVISFGVVVLLSSMVVPAMPEPIGNVAHAGDCDDNCLAALALCRQYCGGSESKCKDKCDLYDGDDNTRCVNRCGRERKSCASNCDLAYRACLKAFCD
jgi:hypothetical protein